MPDRTYNVLFLCTGNTARSILAECILRARGGGRFAAYSAGSQPKGVVNPFALKVLAAHGIATAGARSKSWQEFAGPGAPVMDFVFTVCDNAAGEACPLWPGQPITAHWGIEDPAAVEGSDADKEQAFEQAFRLMQSRVEAFVALPLDNLERRDVGQSVSQSVAGIGQLEGATRIR